MTEQLPCIHIGSPKTGTSTLQQQVFPRHPEIDFLFWPKRTDAPEFYNYLYSDSIRDTDEARVPAAAFLADLLSPSSKVVVFSREHLTGGKKFDMGQSARRLKPLFGDAKIIFTIRNQSNWLVSSYVAILGQAQRPWRGGLPPTFQSYLQAQWDERYRGRLVAGDFGAIARCYVEQFGRDRVAVFLFEDLVANPEDYYARMFKFIGVDPSVAPNLVSQYVSNPRLTRRRYLYWRMRALCVPIALLYAFQRVPRLTMFDRFLSGGPPVDFQISSEWRSRLEDYYRPGNRYLADTFGLPLDRHGYAL